jgi:HD domain-containing protein
VPRVEIRTRGIVTTSRAELCPRRILTDRNRGQSREVAMTITRSVDALVSKEPEPHKTVRYLAYVRQDGTMFTPHDLDEHLRGVGQRAEEYARNFCSEDWAQVAGLWHDLGKYSAEFQRRIKSVSGYNPDAHLEGQVGRVDHSTAGAQHAVEQFGVHRRVLAYIIAGHHAGLPDWYTSETFLPVSCAILRRSCTQPHWLGED